MSGTWDMTEPNIDKLVKLSRMEAIVNTYTKMVELHPDNIEILTKMFKAKLFALENEKPWDVKKQQSNGV